MRGRFGLLGGIGFVIALLLPRASAASHLYVSPTAGVWHWDEEAYQVDLDKTWNFVYGARLGYAFTQAFSGELLGLTGTNSTTSTAAIDQPSTESLRLSELGVSLLVHFQSLTSTRFYPFLDLGVATAIRRGGPFDDEHTAFHLGGGLMVVLDPRFALRTNLRDTFFTDKRSGGNLTQQFTVDALELSLGVEFRILTNQKGSRPE